MTKILIGRSVVEQALGALVSENSLSAVAMQQRMDAITALRAALAQQAEPVQEPVAWMEPPHGAIRANPNYKFTFPSQLLHWRIPLYTTPPQRKPLTDEEIEMAYREIWRDLPTDFYRTSFGWIEQGIKYAERAHGIGEAK